MIRTVAGQEPAIPGKKLSLLFIGDIMGHDEQIWSAEDRETNTYDYNDVFKYVKPVISEADLAIANFEVTLAGPPYQGYPKFSSPSALAAACKNCGIDILVTANNHSSDRLETGIEGTIKRLDSIGIYHTGTFIDEAERDTLYPLLIKKNDITISILNYTYGTNGIKVPSPYIVNMLDRINIEKDIIRAREMNPDLIIMFLHWGTEYDTIPSPDQTELAEYCLSKGADIIIGSHPHVIQKMNWYRESTSYSGKIVVYSLGNFITNQRRPKTDGGALVRIDLEKNIDNVVVTDAKYILTWVYTPIYNYRKKYFILPCPEFEDKPDFFENQADYKIMTQFATQSRKFLSRENTGIEELK